MGNKQLHNDTELPYLSTWIINQFKNFLDVANKTEEALHFKIGKKTFKPRLKPRLLQSINLEARKTKKTTKKEDIFLHFICKSNIVKTFTVDIFETTKIFTHL